MGVKLKKVYIVDTENKHKSYVSELDRVGAEDDVIVFQTGVDPKINMSMLNKIMQCKGRILFENGFIGTANALDMQISTLMGFLISCDAYEHYIIVSKDNGFLRLADYWKSHGVSVHICEEIGIDTEKVLTERGIMYNNIDWNVKNTNYGVEVLRKRETNKTVGFLSSTETTTETDDSMSKEKGEYEEFFQGQPSIKTLSTDTKVTDSDEEVETDEYDDETVEATTVLVNEGNGGSGTSSIGGGNLGLYRRFPMLTDNWESYRDSYAELLAGKDRLTVKTAFEKLDELLFIYHGDELGEVRTLMENADTPFGKLGINTLATMLLCADTVETFESGVNKLLSFGILKCQSLTNTVDFAFFVNGLCKKVKGQVTPLKETLSKKGDSEE